MNAATITQICQEAFRVTVKVEGECLAMVPFTTREDAVAWLVEIGIPMENIR